MVEYSGPASASKYYSVKAESSRIDVRVYYLFEHDGSLGENKDIPQAEITYMPNTHFHGIWDRFVSLPTSNDSPGNPNAKSNVRYRPQSKSDLEDE